MINKEKDEACHKYDDIINLPHPVSTRHQHMPVADRAAQFAPFAALTGHDAQISETARLTDDKIELDESTKAILDEKLRYLEDNFDDMPIAVFTYFVADKKKSGGKYVSERGVIKKSDTFMSTITLLSGTVIPIDDIAQIDSDVFNSEQWL